MKTKYENVEFRKDKTISDKNPVWYCWKIAKPTCILGSIYMINMWNAFVFEPVCRTLTFEDIEKYSKDIADFLRQLRKDKANENK